MTMHTEADLVTLLDRALLEELRGLLGPQLQAVVATFESQAAVLTERVLTASAAADLHGTRHAAHQLKGAAGALGARELFELATRIEGHALANEADAVRDRCAELQAVTPRAVLALQRYLASP